MKIIQNIVPVIKLYNALKHLAPFKNEITRAREAADFEREREFILKATSTWGKQLLKIYGIDLVVTGRENLPDKGPVVFAANHQGYADIPVTCAALDKFQFGYLAKSDLENLPFYGWWMKHIRSVFIKRDDIRASLQAIDEGIDLVEKGFSLLVFPEGTRSKGGPVAEFKKGSLRLATKPGVPVIPITIKGTHRAFEDHGYIKSGARVDLFIHPAIETKGMDKAAAGLLLVEIEKIVTGSLS